MILFVAPEMHEASLRSRRLLRALAARTLVELVVVGDDKGLPDDVAVVDAAFFPRSASAVAKRLHAVSRRVPIQTARTWSPAAARHVDQRISAGAKVVVDQIRMAEYRPAHGPYVVNTNDVESLLHRQLQPAGVVGRADHAWDGWALRRFEQRLLNDGRSHWIAVSDLDARSYLPRVTVVPNATDLPADPGPVDVTGPLLFVGTLTYEPNQAGLRWWSEEVWPRLRHREPLHVVGRGGAAALGGLASHPALEVIGDVEDVGPHLRGCGAVLVPLHAGSGTRIKVVEALGWARPVVSTRKGVEGWSLDHGEQVLLADQPEMFAAEVDHLRSDPELAGRLAARGRAFALAFSWDRVGEAFAEEVLRVLG